MERELKEEPGLEISLEGIRPAMTMNFSTGFDDIYAMTSDMNLADIEIARMTIRDKKYQLIVDTYPD